MENRPSLIERLYRFLDRVEEEPPKKPERVAFDIQGSDFRASGVRIRGHDRAVNAKDSNVKIEGLDIK